MNIILVLGLLVITSYLAGKIFEKFELPKIIAYIIVGITLSPNNTEIFNKELLENTDNLLSICLAFIAFEVGGELNWKKIKTHETKISRTN